MAVNVTGLQLKSFQAVPDWRHAAQAAPMRCKRSGRAFTGTRGEGSREVEGFCAGAGAGALAYFLAALSGVWRNEQAGVGAGGGHEAVQRLACRVRGVVHHEQEFEWSLCTPRLSPSASRITSLQSGSLDSSQLVLPKLDILHMTLIHRAMCTGCLLDPLQNSPLYLRLDLSYKCNTSL